MITAFSSHGGSPYKIWFLNVLYLFIIYFFNLSFKDDFKDETPTKLINVSYFCLMTVNLTDVGANNDNSLIHENLKHLQKILCDILL